MTDPPESPLAELTVWFLTLHFCSPPLSFWTTISKHGHLFVQLFSYPNMLYILADPVPTCSLVRSDSQCPPHRYLRNNSCSRPGTPGAGIRSLSVLNCPMPPAPQLYSGQGPSLPPSTGTHSSMGAPTPARLPCLVGSRCGDWMFRGGGTRPCFQVPLGQVCTLASSTQKQEIWGWPQMLGVCVS